VSGTDMTGYYVQGGVGGTANIFLENGARADLIEAGAILLPATDVLIVVDNSVLNGAQPGRIYDRFNNGNKDYTLGSAIFIDPADRGTHTINVVNGSESTAASSPASAMVRQSALIKAPSTMAASMWLALAPIRFR
jgi:hypothetical protein